MGRNVCGLRTGAAGRRGAARLLLVGLVAVAMSGCAGRGGSVPYNVPNFGAPDTDQFTVPASQQRIAPLDQLNVSVFQVAELTGQFQVDAEGKLQFPLIGAVQAQGLLPDELARQLAQQLGQRYLRNPDVRVSYAQRSEQTVTVEGAVREPGVLPMRGATTLLRAIALAHGTTEDANPGRVIVFRTIEGQRMAAAFDLRAIRRGEAEDPAIYGNDIVVVDGSSVRRLFRDIATSIPILGVFSPLVVR